MTFRACSSGSGLLSAFAISRSCFCISGSRAAAMASNVMSVSFRVVMSVLCFVDCDKNGQTQKGRTYTNFRSWCFFPEGRTYTNSRLPPFWGVRPRVPLSDLEAPRTAPRGRATPLPRCARSGLTWGACWPFYLLKGWSGWRIFSPRFAGSNILAPIARANRLRLRGVCEISADHSTP